MKQIVCNDTHSWRKWLTQNHKKQNEVLLVFFKGEKTRMHLTYDQALDEALCFGWIDSLIKRIDDERYARKFSIRKLKSKWSLTNKAKVESLIKEGRMTTAGLAAVEAAKADGSWDKPERPQPVTEVPQELKKALSKNREAKRNFGKLAPSHRTRYIMWIAMARRRETIEKRVKEAVELLSRNEELGLR